MMYRTHALGGVASGTVTATIMLQHTTNPILLAGSILAGSIFGSLIIDIDHHNSYISKKLWLLAKLLQSMKIEHRGVTHSPFFVILVTAILLYVANLLPLSYQLIGFALVIGNGVGMASHLLLDAMTKGGIPIYYPFSKAKLSLLPIRTGSFGETIVFVVLVAGLGLYLGHITHLTNLIPPR
jgi:inner membrane protein